MKSETTRMLDAFEDYYEVEYNSAMRRDLTVAIGHPPKNYLLELYKQVTAAHPSQYGKLPDVAVVNKVRNAMGPVETYREEQLTIEGPIEVITKAMEKAKEMKMEGGVANWDEVNRVGLKIAKGDGTDAEKHWHWCMTENAGVWKKSEVV